MFLEKEKYLFILRKYFYFKETSYLDTTEDSQFGESIWTLVGDNFSVI